MPLNLIEGALGGIGLFLLGMRLMSDGIRTVADARIRDGFAALTSNRFTSMLFGLIAALALNSGSAAVIFTIGLINGGVLNVFQALSVLGGTLIGASLTLHLNIIPYSLVSTPLIFFGVVLKFFSRRRRYANAGDLILGIGLLFFGLTLLEGSYRPFDRHPLYTIFSGFFFEESLPATFFGALVSFLVQSARSSVNVLTTLSQTYDINIVNAACMVQGGLIGVAAMGCLASVGGNIVTRRVAMTYLLLALCVAIVLIPAVPLLVDVSPCSPGQQLFCQLSWVHTASSLLVAAILVIVSSPLSRMLGYADAAGSTGSNVPQPCAGYLDERILNTPPLAMEQARKEIMRMMSVTANMYADVHDVLFDYDARRAETIRQHEQVLDSLNHEITAYLAALARNASNPEINYDIPNLFQIVTDLEHIGDSCEGILGNIVSRKEAGVIFSDTAMDDLKSIADAVGATVNTTEYVIRNGNAMDADELHESKAAVRAVFSRVKDYHFERLSSGVCAPRAAMLFNDITSAFLRITELCWNITSSAGRKRS